MKKNKISKNWLIKKHRDPFFKKAKIEGYRSRSSFKLIEMNEKFNFLNKNSHLLDLGSAPGGWSQEARQNITKAIPALPALCISFRKTIRTEPTKNDMFFFFA